jgi:uncharacterized membrane protein YfcA
MDFTLPLIGLFVGILVGTTGVGGASILTPILIYVGVNPIAAIGTDFAYNSITKLFGALQHWRQGTVRLQIVFYLAIGSIPSAIAAVLLLKWIDATFNHTDLIVKKVLGLVLICVSLFSIWKEIRHNPDTSVNKWMKRNNQEKRGLTIVLGTLLGFVVGFTSIGSGSLFALALYHLYVLSGKEIVGTDIAHAFLLTTVAGLVHFGFGNVDFKIVFQLVSGSIPGVILGSLLSSKFPTKLLRCLVLFIILISGMMLL